MRAGELRDDNDRHHTRPRSRVRIGNDRYIEVVIEVLVAPHCVARNAVDLHLYLLDRRSRRRRERTKQDSDGGGSPNDSDKE